MTRWARATTRYGFGVVVAALLAVACGDAATTSEPAAVTSTPAVELAPTTAAPGGSEPAVTTAPAATGTEPGPTVAAMEPPEDDSPPVGTAPCGSDQRPVAGEYAVVNIPADDPDGGLVARRLPGAGSEQLDVLPAGTIVEAFGNRELCAVAADGGVWWEIGTPRLATGGWVNSRFLEPLGGGSGEGGGQDDFDTTLAQLACVYQGDTNACDLLETFGLPASDNYGLGNSYSQAPDAVLSEDCEAGDLLACAELASRG